RLAAVPDLHRQERKPLRREPLPQALLHFHEVRAPAVEGKRHRRELARDAHARRVDARCRPGDAGDGALGALVGDELAVDVEEHHRAPGGEGLMHGGVVVDRGDLVFDADAAGERLGRDEQGDGKGGAHAQCAAPWLAVVLPAGCASYHLKYLMNWRISGSVRLWFGIGMLLYSFSIAFACSSVFSIVSGDFSQRASQSSLRCLVTPARSGPSFLPPPMVWQARHLLSKASLPATASGSVGVAVAGMLWCSSSW